MAIVSVALPGALKRAADTLARDLGVSLNQFIASAVAEKVSALRTLDDLEARAKRADPAAFRAVLARAGRGNPPVSGDELPLDLTADERS